MAIFVRCVFSVLVCLCFRSSPVDAAVIVSIDWNPSAAGIQSGIATLPGSNVAADLVLELTGSTILSSYGFSLRFDTNELSFLSRTETPPPGFDEIDFSNPSLENAGSGFAPIGNYGELLRFDGGSVGPGMAGPGQYIIASLLFTAISPSGLATDVDVLPGTFEPLFDDFFDSEGDSLLSAGELQFEGGSVSLQTGVTAVPEPGSFVLLSLMSGAFAFVRGRRKIRRGVVGGDESSLPAAKPLACE